MKNILPKLPKVVYLIDLQRFRPGNMLKNQSYLSYPSYLPVFVNFLGLKEVDKIGIVSTPQTPCKEIKYSKKPQKMGPGWVRLKAGQDQKNHLTRCLKCWPSTTKRQSR